MPTASILNSIKARRPGGSYGFARIRAKGTGMTPDVQRAPYRSASMQTGMAFMVARNCRTTPVCRSGPRTGYGTGPPRSADGRGDRQEVGRDQAGAADQRAIDMRQGQDR